MAWVFGSELNDYARREALSCFVHRFTGDHRPSWSSYIWKDGQTYPLHFKNDREWLSNTKFCINKSGNLDRRVNYCLSNPTFPHNPELRTKYSGKLSS